VERAILLSREIEKMSSPSNHLRVDTLCNLAAILDLRYRRTGDTLANEESISMMRNLLDAIPDNHPKLITLWQNLAIALQSRADHLHDVESIDESIRLLRLVVRSLPRDHNITPMAWSNLSRALERKWFSSATLQTRSVLEEAIDCEEKALKLITPEHRHWTTAQLNRATLFISRYKVLVYIDELASKQETAQGLLTSIITACQDALEAAAPGDWNRTRAHLTLAEVHVVQNTDHYNVGSAIEHLLQASQSSVSELPLLIQVLIDYIPKVDVRDLSIDIERRLLVLYARTIELLPLVADFALDGRAQLKNVKVASNLGTAAFACALRAGKLEQGLEILELARGMMWSQALYLRDPQMGDVPPEHAAQLRSLLQSLTQSSSSTSREQLGSDMEERHRNKWKHSKAAA
jgi:tetratricopeptide (TPR) repeat protein